MSRGVRDLRDLICVSRLTCHDSDEGDFSDGSISKLNKDFNRLSSTSDFSDSKPTSPTNVASSSKSPDSGFLTNGSPASTQGNGQGNSTTVKGPDETAVTGQLQPGTAKFKSQKKKKRKKNGSLPTEPGRHELPKPSPLPPVQSVPGTPVLSEHDLARESSIESVHSAKSDKRPTRVNFDNMLVYLDATIVAGWLTRANDSLQLLSEFITKGDSFVQFAHFWLLNFPDIQKRDIFSMEYDILLDEMSLAFAVGKENHKIVRKDILDLCGAVFKEYPMKLLSVKGGHLFLNYLDVLTSDKQSQYKTILSDVRCSTSNRQYAQWLLAIRGFALVNIWSSVVNFYRNLAGNLHGMPILDFWSSKETVSFRRMLQAIRLGYVEVIHYLIVSGHSDPTQSDSHKRSLIFSAVVNNQAAVLKYLLTRVHPVLEVNQAADTGNTALHAAANNGNLEMVQSLCQAEGIDVNCRNKQCENATPLHLAVMHGHEKVVECLLQNGADISFKMDGTTVIDMARDFEHLDIVDLLQSKNNLS